MRPDLLHILQHSLGLDRHGLYEGGRDGYRNYFATGPDCDSYAPCRELAMLGFMIERPPRGDLRPYSTFIVTELGREAVAEHSPPAPKLTRSQKRYQRFLDHDCGMKFRDWLRTEMANV